MWRPTRCREMECVACGDVMPASDGVACSLSHFMCHSCFEVQVRTSCERLPAELAQQAALVSCSVCSEEIVERVVAVYCPCPRGGI